MGWGEWLGVLIGSRTTPQHQHSGECKLVLQHGQIDVQGAIRVNGA